MVTFSSLILKIVVYNAVLDDGELVTEGNLFKREDIVGNIATAITIAT